jgi:hypothetical protein
VKRVLLALLLAAAAASAAEAPHSCDDVAPGQGLRMERLGKIDRWCGWFAPPSDGVYSFDTNVKTTRVMIRKEVMPKGIALAKGDMYAIVVETAPLKDGHNHKLFLEYATEAGRRTVMPTELYPPTLTVRPNCEAIP